MCYRKQSYLTTLILSTPLLKSVGHIIITIKQGALSCYKRKVLWTEPYLGGKYYDLNINSNLRDAFFFGSWSVNGNEESTLGSGFFGSLNALRFERSRIDLRSKETQTPFSDSFGFKNPILDFLKETHFYSI